MSWIVIADDDEFNRDILCRMLKRIACGEVKAFESGVEAWQFIQKHPKDVILAVLDKMMPQMTGMDVFTQMQAHEQCAHIPVIFQSGDARQDQIVKDLKAGIFGYLSKPFNEDELKKLTHKALEIS